MTVDILAPSTVAHFGTLDTMKFTPEEDSKSGMPVEPESPLYRTDEFRMYCFKVLPCSKRYCHDWTTCPFAHPGEKAKRRDPRFSQYTGIACPEMKKNLACPRGETCPYAHNVFEYWLHPSRYRTQLCNDGVNCKRKVCFFAHTLEELRVPACKPVLPDGTGDSARNSAEFAFPSQAGLQSLSAEESALQKQAPTASPVSILGTGSELWEVGTSPATTPSSSWSPYAGSICYSNRSSYDNSSATVNVPNVPTSPPQVPNMTVDQLAQTLASLNLTAQQHGDQPLASILSALINQQQANTLASPTSVNTSMSPASAAAAASALFPSQQVNHPVRSFPLRQTPPTTPFQFGSGVPSPSSAILGNRPEPAIDPSFPYQSALYAPAAFAAQIQASQQAAQQAAAQQVAAYAAEVDSIRRRSLDSATEALYNRLLSQQMQAASCGRRSFDVRPRTHWQALQPAWSVPVEGLAPSFDGQQQQQQSPQQRSADAAGAEEAEQLLRSAFTSASQELSSDDELLSGSLSTSLSANLDMFRMLSDMQQQQQQQQQQ